MKNYTVNKIVVMALASSLIFSCSNQNQDDNVEAENNTTEAEIELEQGGDDIANEGQQAEPLLISKVTLQDVSNNMLGEVVNNHELTLFAASWQKKTSITFVQKPKLPYLLTLYRDGIAETWLFDGSNVVTLEGKSNTGYYSVPSLNIFKKYMNPQF